MIRAILMDNRRWANHQLDSIDAELTTLAAEPEPIQHTVVHNSAKLGMLLRQMGWLIMLAFLGGKRVR